MSALAQSGHAPRATTMPLSGDQAVVGAAHSEQPSHTILVFLNQCEDGHITPARLLVAIQPRGKAAANAPKAVHCPYRDRGAPRCWDQDRRTQARLDQKLFHRCQDGGARQHEEFPERAAARVMSDYGPKRTSASALHMSAFGGKADMPCCTA